MGIMTDIRRRAAGFTLSEMLIVIALITLLASFSIPGLVALKRDLEVTRLDEAAKGIFVATQDRLTRLSRGGQLDELRSGGTSIGTVPSDFTGGDADWLSGEYYYAKRGSDAAKLLLPLGSIDDSVRLGGDYIIEYSVQSATVYSVFYSDKVILDYNKIDDASSQYRAARKNRRRLKIGYYGGGGIARESFGKCTEPLLTVINGNELKISIAGQDAGCTVSALLEDKHGHSAEVATVGSELILDSLTSGERFKDKFSALTPGDDITVTVTFEKPDCLPSSASTTVNSLFAQLNNDTAEIGCARHLQNLDTVWSGVSSDISKAKQTANISLSGVDYSSVSNDALKSYEGNTQKITDLSGSNGVFASLSGAALNNIYVVNARIGGGSSVGMLAGSLTGCTVTGCRVYAYAGEPGAVDYTAYPNCRITYSPLSGGLIGSASGCTVNGSFAALPALSGATAGGLIGSADGGTTVSNCYAACDYFEGTGMLIGTADGSVSVNNCYAVGTSTGDPSFASGASVSGSYYIYSCNGSRTADGSGLASGATVNAASTRPYDQALDGQAYPYDVIPGMPHFGSWPGNCVVNFYLNSNDSAPYGSIDYSVGAALHTAKAYNDLVKRVEDALRADGLKLLQPNCWVYIDGNGNETALTKQTVVTGSMNLYANSEPKNNP